MQYYYVDKDEFTSSVPFESRAVDENELISHVKSILYYKVCNIIMNGLSNTLDEYKLIGEPKINTLVTDIEVRSSGIISTEGVIHLKGSYNIRCLTSTFIEGKTTKITNTSYDIRDDNNNIIITIPTQCMTFIPRSNEIKSLKDELVKVKDTGVQYSLYLHIKLENGVKHDILLCSGQHLLKKLGISINIIKYLRESNDFLWKNYKNRSCC
jgi:hypothetical protein